MREDDSTKYSVSPTPCNHSGAARVLSLVLAEPNIINLAYREGGNGLTLHVLTQVGAVGRSDGADDHFGAALLRTLFHLPNILASPASPCLVPALLKTRVFLSVLAASR